MWAPSTSASVMKTILSYLNLLISNSLPTLVPNAVIIVPISWFANTRSCVAFSTLIILPLNGKIAWYSLSRPSFAEPPAESPSTIYNSQIDESFDEQSANLPGNVENVKAFFLVKSLALLAAKRALEAKTACSKIVLASSGFSNKNLSNCSVKILLTKGLISELHNFVFVWPSYWGFGCLI